MKIGAKTSPFILLALFVAGGLVVEGIFDEVNVFASGKDVVLFFWGGLVVMYIERYSITASAIIEAYVEFWRELYKKKLSSRKEDGPYISPPSRHYSLASTIMNQMVSNSVLQEHRLTVNLDAFESRYDVDWKGVNLSCHVDHEGARFDFVDVTGDTVMTQKRLVPNGRLKTQPTLQDYKERNTIRTEKKIFGIPEVKMVKQSSDSSSLTTHSNLDMLAKALEELEARLAETHGYTSKIRQLQKRIQHDSA